MNRFINRYKKSIICAAFIFLLCSVNFSSRDIGNLVFLKALHADKIFHAFMFYVFTILLLNELKFNNKSGFFKPYLITFSISMLYGIMIEIAQSQIFLARSGDLYDLAGNLAGTTFAAVQFFIFFDHK
jgi:hypothetical protein